MARLSRGDPCNDPHSSDLAGVLVHEGDVEGTLFPRGSCHYHPAVPVGVYHRVASTAAWTTCSILSSIR